MLGTELIRGTRLTKDLVRGEKTLVGACSMGDLYACGDLASHYLDNKQASRGLTVLQTDCEASNGISCAKMGGWLSRCEDGRPAGMSPSENQELREIPRHQRQQGDARVRERLPQQVLRCMSDRR